VILPDTAIWIDHIHRKDEQLSALLRVDQVLIHPFVMGEIALGSMERYEPILDGLQTLRSAPIVADDDVRYMIRQHKIMGSGIGYVDAHILASVTIVDGAFLWTRDKGLNAVALRMGVARTN